MKVTFLGQGLESESKNAIGYYLTKYLNSNDFDSFIAISAFASQFAIEGIAQDLEKAKNTFSKLTIIVGIDQEGTSKEALDAILSLNVNSYIFYQTEPVIFHPKIYLFEGDRAVKLIIGSSNLTGRGLFKNVESSLLVEYNNDDNDGKKILSDLKEYYKRLLDFTDPNIFKITTDVIQDFVFKGIVPDERARREMYCKKAILVDFNQTNIDIPKRQTARIPSSFFKKETIEPNLKQQLNKALPFIQDLFLNLQKRINSLDNKIKTKTTNSYVAFKLSNNFIEMHIQKKNLKLHLRPIEYNDSRVVKLPDTYKWTLNKRVYIENENDIDYVMGLIEQSYKDIL